MLIEQSEAFQDDIYPDTLSGDPSLTSDEWFAGGDAPLQLLKMESVFHQGVGGQPSRKRDFTPMDSSSKAASQPAATKKVVPQHEAPTQKPPEKVAPAKSSTFPSDKSQPTPGKEQPAKEEPTKDQPITRTQSQPQSLPKSVESVAAKVVRLFITKKANYL
jgi:hypothetical protein